MNTQRRLFCFAGITLCLASGSFAQPVKSDFDRNADFGRYKTYSWEKVSTQNDLWVDRIKAAVNAALSAKGWTQVESGGNVSIVAMEMTQSHQTLNTYYDNFGGDWGWRGWGGGAGGFGESTTTESTYRVGTLVIDLFDSSTKKLVWRGSSSAVLSDKSGKNIKNLDKDVNRMFGHFPPEASKTPTASRIP